MKKILIILSLFISENVFSQEKFYKLPARFYELIDSSHTLQCCDSGYYGISIRYDIPLYELPVQRIDIDEYENQFADGNYLDIYAEDFTEYYKNLKPSIKKKITKSCFKMSTEYKINHDITGDGLYWIEGTLHVKITFQSDDKYFGCPWWKKIFIKK